MQYNSPAPQTKTSKMYQTVLVLATVVVTNKQAK